MAVKLYHKVYKVVADTCGPDVKPFCFQLILIGTNYYNYMPLIIKRRVSIRIMLTPNYALLIHPKLFYLLPPIIFYNTPYSFSV